MMPGKLMHPRSPNRFVSADLDNVNLRPGGTVRWQTRELHMSHVYRCVGRLMSVDPDGRLRVGYRVYVGGCAYKTKIVRIHPDYVLSYTPPDS